MRACFILDDHNRPIIDIEPDDETEAMLMDAFIRYDANLFHVEVVRDEDGILIKGFTIHAENNS